MADPVPELVSTLVTQIPELLPILDDHLEDNFGELLSHLFMSDLARAVQAAQLSGNHQMVQSVVDFLENAISEDSEIEELIGISFVEMLPHPDEPGALLPAP